MRKVYIQFSVGIARGQVWSVLFTPFVWKWGKQSVRGNGLALGPFYMVVQDAL